nr:uncharacterized protein LOC112289467 [Physcomitrium patens]|eukprot:XP_024390475.1 uncharacterized protein LOC112289467 [Physcomitrella patens]
MSFMSVTVSRSLLPVCLLGIMLQLHNFGFPASVRKKLDTTYTSSPQRHSEAVNLQQTQSHHLPIHKMMPIIVESHTPGMNVNHEFAFISDLGSVQAKGTAFTTQAGLVFISTNEADCSERVVIPKSKWHITLQGSGREVTKITSKNAAGDTGTTYTTSTFRVSAPYFTARNISFEEPVLVNLMIQCPIFTEFLTAAFRGGTTASRSTAYNRRFQCVLRVRILWAAGYSIRR